MCYSNDQIYYSIARKTSPFQKVKIFYHKNKQTVCVKMWIIKKFCWCLFKLNKNNKYKSMFLTIVVTGFVWSLATLQNIELLANNLFLKRFALILFKVFLNF